MYSIGHSTGDLDALVAVNIIQRSFPVINYKYRPKQYTRRYEITSYNKIEDGYELFGKD